MAKTHTRPRSATVTRFFTCRCESASHGACSGCSGDGQADGLCAFCAATCATQGRVRRSGAPRTAPTKRPADTLPARLLARLVEEEYRLENEEILEEFELAPYIEMARREDLAKRRAARRRQQRASRPIAR